MTCHHASFFYITVPSHHHSPSQFSSLLFVSQNADCGKQDFAADVLPDDGLAHCSQSELFGSTHHFHLLRTLARSERPRAP
jgi:hypothetical protein